MASEIMTTKPRRSVLQRLPDLTLVLAIALIVALVGLTGCRTAAIRDFNNQPVPPGLKMSQVADAIKSAGISLGWAMKEEYQGKIVGTLYVRDHMARVDIPYSRKSYSIRYAGSTNLKYDAENRTIHSNYDGWVQNLNNQIRARLGSM